MRHAPGAGTHTSGVCDILVIFLSVKKFDSNNNNNDKKNDNVPIMEKATRMKVAARQLICQGPNIKTKKKLTMYLPTNGEAWHYLGSGIMALQEYATLNAKSDGKDRASGGTKASGDTKSHRSSISTS